MRAGDEVSSNSGGFPYGFSRALGVSNRLPQAHDFERGSGRYCHGKLIADDVAFHGYVCAKTVPNGIVLEILQATKDLVRAGRVRPLR
jgi:hypothetical protein